MEEEQEEFVAEPYLEMFEDEPGEYILESGRCSAKSTSIAKLMRITKFRYPDNDIVVGVESTQSMKDTILEEFKALLEEKGEMDNWEFRADGSVANEIGTLGEVRLFATQDSNYSQTNRTRGKKLLRKVSLFVMDETQKLKSEEVLIHTRATFLRQMISNGKVVISGNKERGNWYLNWVEKRKRAKRFYKTLDPQTLDTDQIIAYRENLQLRFIYATYECVWNCLSPKAKNEIITMRDTDNTLYRQVYLGDVDAIGWQVVFGTFNPQKHYLPLKEIPTLCNTLKRDAVTALVFGIDFASNNDGTASLPIALTNQTTVAVLDPYYYYSPIKSNKVIPPSELNKGIIDNIKDVIDSYNIRHGTPIYLSCDCAAAPNIAELRASIVSELAKMRADLRCKYTTYFDDIKIVPFTWKDKENNLIRMRNIFAQEKLLYILNEQGIESNENQLTYEIMAQRYKDDKKLDASVPNDCCDALEYALLYIFNNPHKQYAFINYANTITYENKVLQNSDKYIRRE